MGYLNRARALMKETGPEVNTGIDCAKSVISELSPPPPVAQLLREALADKEKELALRQRDLTTVFYRDDPWVLEQIAHLESHIVEIRRYLKEGGELTLPRCCCQAENICLGAVRGFNICILSPEECGYAIQG